MQTVEQLQITFTMAFEEALEHAVFMRRFLIHSKLTISAKEAENSMDGNASDNSMESSDNDSSDGESIASEFDIWTMTNDKMDDENVSGDARTKRGLDIVLCFMRFGVLQRCDSIYKAIMTTLRVIINKLFTSLGKQR